MPGPSQRDRRHLRIVGGTDVDPVEPDNVTSWPNHADPSLRFDHHLVVDWSANSRPKKGRDAIWVAHRKPDGDIRLYNVPTRREFHDLIATIRIPNPNDTILLTIDAGLGYPAFVADSIDMPPTLEQGWRTLWSSIAASMSDEDDNSNNRFEVAETLNHLLSDGPGPLWGCPPRRASDRLRTTKAPGFPHTLRNGDIVAEYRACEQLLRRKGFKVGSVWQLLGAGSVGSQTLLAITHIEQLRRNYDVLVWPFETGFYPNPLQGRTGCIVVAEFWPTLFDPDLSLHPVRDAAQVLSCAETFDRMEQQGTLSKLFAPPIGIEFTVEEAITAVYEEGWILGVGSTLT
jgi:hypothetical protein